jgi:rhodanese-related sulfurtransferase
MVAPYCLGSVLLLAAAAAVVAMLFAQVADDEGAVDMATLISKLKRRRIGSRRLSFYAIDVRSHGEYNSGALPGAIWIPLDSLKMRLGDGMLPLQFSNMFNVTKPRKHDSEIVTYCDSGYRAQLARQELIALGFQHVYFYRGSAFKDWAMRERLERKKNKAKKRKER